MESGISDRSSLINYGDINLDCPDYSFNSWQYRLFALTNFWVEGVAVAVVASLGTVGNIMATVVLIRKKMRNSFNLLLVAMSAFDTLFLLGMILESFRKGQRLVVFSWDIKITEKPCLDSGTKQLNNTWVWTPDSGPKRPAAGIKCGSIFGFRNLFNQLSVYFSIT